MLTLPGSTLVLVELPLDEPVLALDELEPWVEAPPADERVPGVVLARGVGLLLGLLDSEPRDADPPPPEGTHKTSPSFAAATASGSSAALTVRVQAGVAPDRFVEFEDADPEFEPELPPVLVEDPVRPDELVVPFGAGTSGVVPGKVLDPLELPLLGDELPVPPAVPPVVPPVESVLVEPAPVETPGVSCGPSAPPVEGALCEELPVDEPLVEEPLSESLDDELVEPEPDLSLSSLSLEPESSDFLSEPESFELELSFESESLSFESEESESFPASLDLPLMAGSSVCWAARSIITVRCGSSVALAATWPNAAIAAAASAVVAPAARSTRRRCWG